MKMDTKSPTGEPQDAVLGCRHYTISCVKLVYLRNRVKHKMQASSSLRKKSSNNGQYITTTRDVQAVRVTN